jgi:hypothetical protein
MQPIFLHKIGSHSAKPSYNYPVIRLPREFAGIVGCTACVYQMQNDGKLMFLITVEDKVDKSCATSPCLEDEDRINNLEKRINGLERSIFSNKDNITSENEKERKSKAEGEIRTRVVASTGP